MENIKDADPHLPFAIPPSAPANKAEPKPGTPPQRLTPSLSRRHRHARGASVFNTIAFFILAAVLTGGITALVVDAQAAQKNARVLMESRKIQATFRSLYGQRAIHPTFNYSATFAADTTLLQGIPRNAARTALLNPFGGTYNVLTTGQNFLRISINNLPRAACISLLQSARLGFWIQVIVKNAAGNNTASWNEDLLPISFPAASAACMEARNNTVLLMSI